MFPPIATADAAAEPTRRKTAAATSPRVVVGVAPDGSGTSAVVWAVEETGHDGSRLRMVTAAADALLEAAADALLLVIGRRELSGAWRRLVGGTSLSVSARAPIPVVVVPEPWIQPEMSAAPIVLGLEPRGHRQGTSAKRTGDPARDAIDFAFARAARMRVPLHVIAAVRARPDAMDRGQRPPGGGLGATTRALLRDLRRPIAVIPPSHLARPTTPPTPKEE